MPISHIKDTLIWSACDLIINLGPDSLRVTESAIKTSGMKVLRHLSGRTSKLFPGFSHIQKVPHAMIMEQIPTICYEAGRNSRLAASILQSWFDENKELRGIVATKLKKLGYAPIVQDWESQLFNYRPLKDADVTIEKTQTSEDVYFTPAGNRLDGIDQLEATLMALMLGWFGTKQADNGSANDEGDRTFEGEGPDNTGGREAIIGENAIDDGDSKPLSFKKPKRKEGTKVKTEAGLTGLGDGHTIAGEASDTNNSGQSITPTVQKNKGDVGVEANDLPLNDMGAHPISCDAYENSEGDRIMEADAPVKTTSNAPCLDPLVIAGQIHDEYQIEKARLVGLFEATVRELHRDQYEADKKALDKYNDLKSMAISLDKLVQTADEQLRNDLSKVTRDLGFTSTVKPTAGPETLTSRWSLVRKVCQEANEFVTSNLRELLTKCQATYCGLDADEREELENDWSLGTRLETVAKDLPTVTIKNFEDPLNDLKECQDITDDWAKTTNLKGACDGYLIKHDNRSYQRLVNHVRKDGAPEDVLCLLLMARDDFELSENQLPVLQTTLAVLEKHGPALVRYTVENGNPQRAFANMTPGLRAAGLMAGIAYLQGDTVYASAMLIDCHESLGKWPDLHHYLMGIMNGEQPSVMKEEIAGRADELERELTGCFRQDNRKYVHLLSKAPREFIELETGLFDLLRGHFVKLRNGCSTADAEEIIREVSRKNYCHDLYIHHLDHSEVKDKKHGFFNANITKDIQKIVDSLHPYAEVMKKHAEYGKHHELKTLISDLESIGREHHELKWLVETMRDLLRGNVEHQDNGTCLNSLVLDSWFWGVRAPRASSDMCDKDLDKNQLLETFLKDCMERQPTDALAELIAQGNTRTARAVATRHGFDQGEIDSKQAEVAGRIRELEKACGASLETISDQYSAALRESRWGKAIQILEECRASTVFQTQFHQEELRENIGKLTLAIHELEGRLIQGQQHYSPDLLSKLYNAIGVAKRPAISGELGMYSTVSDIYNEIAHLMEYPSESTEKLAQVLSTMEAPVTEQAGDQSEYLRQSLENILPLVRNDDFNKLGLTEKRWETIAGNRKDDIEDLITDWLFLRDKPTTWDALEGHPERKKIVTTIEGMFRSLSSICHLYRTNENNKIGEEPTERWSKSEKVPAQFCTRIRIPQSEPLSRPVRLFMMTNPQLESHNYLRDLRDYITENGFEKNSFNVVLLIGDRGTYDRLNTFPQTRTIPVLDEQAVKKIIFSHSRKAPKWEFAYHLTLNRDIATMSPFKYEGSVNKNTFIFVGRSEIINRIIASPQDLAIWGGRRIGKSSLLYEIRGQLEEKGYFTSFVSCQGVNIFSTGVQIYQELSRQFGVGKAITLTDDDQLKLELKNLYNIDRNRNVAVFIDEIDDLITEAKNKNIDSHRLIEIFRSLSSETGSKWKFFFAGYKEMYKEIKGKGIYENVSSPWRNFVAGTSFQLSTLETPREVVDLGLRDILGLQLDDQVTRRIIDYTSGHPAFIQNFCDCLVKDVASRITPDNRRISIDDVDRIFQTKPDYSRFVHGVLRDNLSKIQLLIAFVAAQDNLETFTFEEIRDKIALYFSLVPEVMTISDKELELELELMQTTGIVESTAQNCRFANKYYLMILKRIDQLDRDTITPLIKEIVAGSRH